MTDTSMSSRAWGEMLLLALLWAASFLTMALATAEIGPLTVVLHRVGWAAILLWALVVWRGIAVPRTWRIWAAFLVMGALNNVIPFGLIAWGQIHIETGLAAILNAVTALFGVLVAAAFVAEERLTARRLAGVAIGIGGVAVIKGGEAVAALDPASLGQIAVLGAALSYAFAGVWARRTLGGVSPLMAATGMLTGSTVLAFPLAVAAEGWPSLALSAGTWVSIGYFAVFATAFAYLLYYRVLAMAGAGNLLLVTLVIPPLAVWLGWLVLDEAIGWRAIGGFALIAAGLATIDGRVLRMGRRVGR